MTRRPPRRPPAPLALVTGHIARAAGVHAPAPAPAPPPAPDAGTLGAITLLPHQRDAARRLRALLDAHHGALLADDVGLGKTFTALAVARDYPSADILAPASLLPMWQHALRQAEQQHVQLHSLHRFSRTTPPVRTPPSGRHLVIIDEAHHLRSRHTVRYRHVARWVAGHDVLLLSATPLHNRPHDLAHLFALFLGARAGVLDPGARETLVVRRRHDDLLGHSGPTASRPRIDEARPIALPDDPELLQALLTLPAPLPARDGAAAGALIRLGLLRAWCSSDAALAHAIRQRQRRGLALRAALAAGRHPTHAELRSWLVVGDDMQLGFAELLAEQPPLIGDALPILDRHLAALASLLAMHRHRARSDVARAAALRHLARRHPGVPIVAFSQYGTTVHALFRALGDIAGVCALTSRGARIASGPTNRADALARFAPLAAGLPPPPPHQRVTLLLTTDLLAEGVNLQDAGIVVHLDLPWTDALARQRVGRVARLGSPHATVQVHRFDPPAGAEHALRLLQRLRHKARLARTLVGAGADPITRLRHAAARLHALALQAEADRGAEVPVEPADGRRPGCAIAAVRAARRGWIAVVRDDRPALGGEHGAMLVASLARAVTGRTTAPSARPAVAAAALRAVLHTVLHTVSQDAPDGPSSDPLTCPPRRAQLRRAWRALSRWGEDRAARALLGPPSRARSAAQRRALVALRRGLASVPSWRRGAAAPLAARAEAMVMRACGHGADEALEAWMRRADVLPFEAWLAEGLATPLLARCAARTASSPASARETAEAAAPSPAGAVPVVALLLLVPPDDALAIVHG